MFFWLLCCIMLRSLRSVSTFFEEAHILTVTLTLWHISGDLSVCWKILLSMICSTLIVPRLTMSSGALDWRNECCHAGHAWHQLCESASSCSAICSRPGSLIREESGGKVSVFLCLKPHSHYSCLSERRHRRQYQGAGRHAAAAIWSMLRHCGGSSGGGKLKTMGQEVNNQILNYIVRASNRKQLLLKGFNSFEYVGSIRLRYKIPWTVLLLKGAIKKELDLK